MDINYKVYLDNIEIKNIPKGLGDFVLTTTREDGVGNSEQILRDSSEFDLEFWGDGFNYICEKRKQNICDEIEFTLTTLCENKTEKLFTGLIKQSKASILLRKCIAKVSNIKDNSFSGYIRDYLKVEVPLYYLKTKNCFDVSIESILINTPTTPNTYTITDIKAYDCLDVFKFLIAFFTDNKVTVMSDYLTDNKYAITTGYNMHNNSGSLKNTYPTISFEKLFRELRKKLTLYMSIEYAGVQPYIRIEPEQYFYKDELLFEIDELPLDAVENIDENRIFSVIDVGSSNTNIQESTTAIVPQERLQAWNKESYVGCGGCSGEKDTNKLDLVSDLIIDANMIHEAMNEDLESGYGSDESIFLLNYYNSSIGGILYKLVGNNSSNYNESLNNENVLNRWVGLSNDCIAVSRYLKNGFKATNRGFIVNNNQLDATHSDVFSIKDIGACILANLIPATRYLGFADEVFDNMGSHSTSADIFNSCLTGNYKSQFKCMESGIFDFRVFSKIKCFVLSPTNTDDLIDAKFEVRFNVYQDDTLTTLINTTTYVDVFIDNNYDTFQFDINSGDLLLSVGNVVMVETTLSSIHIVAGGRQYDFVFFDSIFELIKDSNSCANIEDNLSLFKPYVTDFDYSLSLAQQNKIKQNKAGYILLAGQKAWIKKVEYKHMKLSSVYLIHKNSYCNCSN